MLYKRSVFFVVRSFATKVSMIQLTAAARQEINRLRQRQGKPRISCRLSLQPSSCAQWAYALSLDAETEADDEMYLFEDVRLVVKRDRLPYIQDLKIDFSEDLMGGAFRFDNPIATETCRCGYAFSAKDFQVESAS